MGSTGCVYCAGPLFNKMERDEMAELADALKGAGLEAFLPQRDGLEYVPCVEALLGFGVAAGLAKQFISRAIFALDVYQVIEACDAIVVNLNGRVPDEGAVSEAAMAWCAGKVVVGYKADGRSVFMGQDNPLVAGLFDFEICETVEQAVDQTVSQLTRAQPSSLAYEKKEAYRATIQFGKKIWEFMSTNKEITKLAELLRSELAVAATD